MTAHATSPWESHLLTLAHAGLEDDPGPSLEAMDSRLLARAYRACETITREHSRTFSLASAFLPAGKRRAARALYAFCRTSDDLVDRNVTADPVRALKAWRLRLLAGRPPGEHPVAMAWADTRLRSAIPAVYAEQLLDGLATDLTRSRYQSFTELAVYAYGVASTVGLMAMHIIGFCGPEAIPYAVRLGVALQLTNILRDVGEDLRQGRLYLPQEELERFGLTEADIAAGVVTPAWRDFMRFQIERTRRLYRQAWPGVAMLARDGRFAIAAAAGLYLAILDQIEKNDYDVFSRRAYLGRWARLCRLAGIWLKVRELGDGAA